MNQELLDIRDLCKVDLEMDALKAEAGALAATVRALRARAADQAQRLADLAAQLDAAVADERAQSRRLKDYQTKAARTKQLMDEGKAFDYLAAEKQHRQLLELADQVETALLEAMDAREGLERDRADLEQQQVQTQGELESARAAEAARRPGISARYGELKPVRERRLEAVQPHHRDRYANLRRKETLPVVDVVDGTCPNCHMEPPPQVLNDIGNGGSRINNCRGCGAFFFEARWTEADEDEDAEGDA